MARRGSQRIGVTAVLPFPSATALGACLCAALLGAAITPAVSLDAAVTDNNPRIFVAPLPSILNTRTLSDYDVRRFFTQFGADPNGVWSNPIGMQCNTLTATLSQSVFSLSIRQCTESNTPAACNIRSSMPSAYSLALRHALHSI